MTGGEPVRLGRTAVAASGGVESAALIRSLSAEGRAVHPVYVRGGHAWERAELHWVKRLLRKLERPNLAPLSIVAVPVADLYSGARWSLSGRNVPSGSSPDESVYLPGRNILLIAKLSVFCAERGIGRLALGTLGSNPFPDASPAFFRSMERAVSSGLARPLAIEAPLRRMSKPAVLLRHPGTPWELTFSCISPRGLAHCGRCNKCAERRRAFSDAGLADPTDYLARGS